MSSKENAAINQLFEKLECRYALRVLWALLAVFAGTGILAYFICALVMPEDDTQV